MRGGPARALLRSVIYVLLACLLMLVGSAAYASQTITAPPTTALSRQHGPIARTMPTPVPAVTTLLSPSTFDQLRGDLETIAARSGARVGISLQELSGPRRNTLSLNGSASFIAGSAYKVPLLMAEAQQIASGQAGGSDVLCFDPDDAEDGWFDDYDPGSCFTRDELSRRTGRYSDNSAAHILVRYLGGADALNAYAKSIGMTASALWLPNTTTPDDLTAAWVNEALGRAGGAAAQRWLFPLLTHSANEHGIPAGVPASSTVVHKIGTLDGMENDSAYIVNGRASYVLSVAVDGIDENLGWSLIAQISARIWQYESSRPDYVAPVIATPVASSARQNRY
jgi:beta-lactamase class A